MQNVSSLTSNHRISENFEIPCQLSPVAKLLSSNFFNASSFNQCIMYNSNFGTKSAFAHESDSE